MSESGAYRNNDPNTSAEAAWSVDVTSLKFMVLRTLRGANTPLNGWELAVLMKLPTITVVPRLAPLRRDGYIVDVGVRPGPSGRRQTAYVLTEQGRSLLRRSRDRKP